MIVYKDTLLSSKRENQTQKAIKEYSNVLNKYDPDSTDYLVNVILYTETSEDDSKDKPKKKKKNMERIASNIYRASDNTSIRTYRS